MIPFGIRSVTEQQNRQLGPFNPTEGYWLGNQFIFPQAFPKAFMLPPMPETPKPAEQQQPQAPAPSQGGLLGAMGPYGDGGAGNGFGDREQMSGPNSPAGFSEGLSTNAPGGYGMPAGPTAPPGQEDIAGIGPSAIGAQTAMRGIDGLLGEPPGPTSPPGTVPGDDLDRAMIERQEEQAAKSAYNTPSVPGVPGVKSATAQAVDKMRSDVASRISRGTVNNVATQALSDLATMSPAEQQAFQDAVMSDLSSAPSTGLSVSATAFGEQDDTTSGGDTEGGQEGASGSDAGGETGGGVGGGNGVGGDNGVGGMGDDRRKGGPTGDDKDGRFEKVPIMAHEGEFVQRPEAVKHYGLAFMEAINERKIPKSKALGLLSMMKQPKSGRGLLG